MGAAHGIHSARSASATENVKITIVAEPFNNIDRFKAVRDFFPDSGARSLLSPLAVERWALVQRNVH